MAFDKSTRNRLARFVGDARGILTEEFTRQCKQIFGIDPDTGAISELNRLTHLNDTQRATAQVLRETFNHYSAGSPSSSKTDVLLRIIREQAFTVLNRLCALRMAEARGILVESVVNEYKSKGFQLYESVAGPSLGETGDSYRNYLFSVFDELALDLASLFDRFSPQGRLFPTEAALRNVLAEINHLDLEALWTEDETIGWLYQYFNSQEERKKMRDESAAPRNSRELAVRNQFFTPRYVVEFLTDNTLGRIWYEMTQGDTTLKEQCRYLVRRPTEIFLKTGDTAPEQPKQENLSQEDLLKQPVHIPHRPLKDPRTILMLDPACGSMHFGLYAFDLFEVIYDEAWALEEKLGADALSRSLGMKSLHSTYPSKNAFLKDVPRLIIENNLHGIDIDPRCAQIAGLSLWLRAQKAWQRLGLKPAERPAIKRSNIVCAEPMPGEKELLREFVEREFPAAERAVCLRLLEAIFDKMQLAGEAGSLLKIEEEIRSAIEDARRQATTPRLFDTDVRSLNSEDFWERIEERIYDALRDYAEQAESGGGFQRRLFAEDAARGFAFIDVCRKRYDVALMNPPFGETSGRVLALLETNYPCWNSNLLCAFIGRSQQLLAALGTVGAIFDKTALVKSSYEKFRDAHLFAKYRPPVLIDLGWGVLDTAQVETSLAVWSDGYVGDVWMGKLGVTGGEKNEIMLLEECRRFSNGKIAVQTRTITLESIRTFPNQSVPFDAKDWLVDLVARSSRFEMSIGKAMVGCQIKADVNFRVFWELPGFEVIGIGETWSAMFNGGEFSPYVAPIRDVVRFGNQGDAVPFHKSNHLTNIAWQQKPGFGWGKRGDFVDTQIMPAGCVFTIEGQALPSPQNQLWPLGLLNSRIFWYLMNVFCGQHKYAGYVNVCPVPAISGEAKRLLEQIVGELCMLIRPVFTRDETTREFCVPYGFRPVSNLSEFASAHLEERRELAQKIARADTEINATVYDWFDVGGEGIADADRFSANAPIITSALELLPDLSQLVLSLTTDAISFSVGVAFGRWDIRYGTGEQAAPELPDPFAPLPVCPPGQLQNAQGLPARPEDVPAAYPVRIPWDGILVDDPNHPLDLERRVREVIEIIWSGQEGGPTAEAIEHEACEILGVKSLRDYFRKPAGFFADHLKRYSKSRRQAPIYWPLSTASGSYTLWLYYHRLTDQTLFSAINNCVEPKLAQISSEATQLRSRPTRSANDERVLEGLSELELELRDFRDELLRVAKFWKPNLNDGVLLTAAPLWKLFQFKPWQKKLKEAWGELEQGDYDWAHIALSIWPERVRDKCKTDRSMAIAHGLEELHEALPANTKKKRKKTTRVEDQLFVEDSE